jgi:N terminus of Rad21 / Rec8 like protein
MSSHFINLAHNPGTTNSPRHVFYLRAPLSTRQWFWSSLVIDPHLLFTLLVMLNAIRRLAATFGARSSFKKLPKRDVMGADIAQLCNLITEPAEPLALRLSSNLMIGVAR